MNYEQRELQSRVELAAACFGDGTELVTVWVPEDKNIQSIQSRIQNEAAEASNIKSKQTRERVEGALDRVLAILRKYTETPENGLVVCAGYVNGDYVTFEFANLPEPIGASKYSCSDEFEVDALWQMAFGGSEYWGLVAVTRDSASVGRYTNTEFDYVDVIDTFESHVQGKFKAGGQSAQRFARLREKQQEEHYKKVVRLLEENFDTTDDEFKGLAIGGPGVSVSDFKEWLPSRFEQAVVTTERVDHAGSEESLVALARQAEDAFSEHERANERELVMEFKKRLRDDSRAAYGEEEVRRALDYGAVDTLLLSADFSTDYINDLTEAVEQQGGDAVIISTMHEEGQTLDRVFNGVAALLRFDIH